eukprot:6175342-Pleurochrysis_carterae.AAC.3
MHSGLAAALVLRQTRGTLKLLGLCYVSLDILRCFEHTTLPYNAYEGHFQVLRQVEHHTLAVCEAVYVLLDSSWLACKRPAP